MTELATRRDAIRLAGALIAAAKLSFPRGAAGASAAGTVAATVGQSFIDAGGRRTALKPGDAVTVGGSIDVPVGSKLKLAMTDGTGIAAASGTQITILTYRTDPGGQRQQAKISLARGLVRAVVAPSGNTSGFEIATPTGTAAAQSTDCFVEALPDATSIGVLTGRVTMSSTATARTVAIPARWGARVEAGRDPVPARLWSAAEFAAVIARTDLR